MNKNVLVLIVLFSNLLFSQEITLKHNIGSTLVDQLYNFTCSGGGVDWARVYVLEDFGITEEYTITSGSFGIEEANTSPGDGVVVNVYEIDIDFPDSFDETLLLGSSAMIDIPPTGNQIFAYNFDPPIVVSTDIDMILVEVHLGFQTQNVFIGGTSDSYDYSWFRAGCMGNPNDYQNTYDINRPNLNYYITVTGDHLLGINDINKESVTLAPNPVSNRIMINMNPEFNADEVVVYDINGKIVLKDHFIEELDVSDLANGLYFLKIRSPEGFISKKFIKK